MEIGKFKFKLLVLIFIIALVLPIIMIVKAEIKINIEIDKTREVLKNINANEMREKIINKLNNSALNLNTNNYSTQIGMIKNIDNKSLKACNYSYVPESENDYVYAVITDKKQKNGVAIPLFKIESKSNGNFQEIEYVDDYYILDNVSIYGTIWDTLKNDYGLKEYHGTRYFSHFYGGYQKPRELGEEKYIKYNDKEFAELVLILINNSNDESQKYFISNEIQKPEETTIYGLFDE